MRRALKLDKRDKLHCSIRADGAVVITRAVDVQQEDPALAPFLNFLAKDIASHPEQIKAMDSHLRQRIQNLVGEIEVDLEPSLSDDDE
ncbi:type II toxin-antitoxin system PrlF family antitoxin [Undibacterium sp. Ji50W]|uniref:type II toxin-antitoxin system PrlF family antitoxin n=1 Tax=Undibacterium sp. Ji50W TaxID=3413041 RepID=UPI003BF35ADF